MDNNQNKFTMIDTESLAYCLAESDWKEETESHPTIPLYEAYTDSAGVRRKQISSHWARVFWDLVEQYRIIISSFQENYKPDEFYFTN